MNRVEICGNIASGKTTLCQGMAKKGYFPLYENFQKNPFFEDFYKDPVAYCFETEITFLLQHYNLIKKQKAEYPVSDYSLLLDMAYADINLVGDRKKIFFEIAKELEKEIGHPDKIVYLICPEKVLLERIILRSRDAETSITTDYLQSLSRAITLRVKDFEKKGQIITIDSNAINFTSGIEGIRELEKIIPNA